MKRMEDVALVLLTNDEIEQTISALNKAHPTEATHACPGCDAKAKLPQAWPLEGVIRKLGLTDSQVAGLLKGFRCSATEGTEDA